MGQARLAQGQRPRGRRWKHTQSLGQPGRLSGLLNKLAPEGGEPAEGWSAEVREVERILESRRPPVEPWKLPLKVVKRFNRLASASPVQLMLSDGTEFRGVPALAYPSGTGYVLGALWLALHDPGIVRMKRCAQCQKWFIDRTRNNQAKRCSQECTSRWWTRPRRRRSATRRARVSG